MDRIVIAVAWTNRPKYRAGSTNHWVESRAKRNHSRGTRKSAEDWIVVNSYRRFFQYCKFVDTT